MVPITAAAPSGVRNPDTSSDPPPTRCRGQRRHQPRGPVPEGPEEPKAPGRVSGQTPARPARGTTEFELLATLGRHRGRVLSKVRLLSLVWGYDAYDPNVVEAHVSALRAKLEAHGPRLVHTVRGAGYVLRP